MRYFSFCFSAIFAFLGLNPTAYSAPRVPAPLLENSLIYCTNVSSFSFNPQKVDIGTNMNVVTEQLYDKLVEFDIDNGKLRPMLAERYQFSEDGKTITLFLRKNVAFHTTPWFTPSRKMNADDVIFSLNRMSGVVGDLPALNRHSKNEDSYQKHNSSAYQRIADEAHFPYFESVNFREKIAHIEAVNAHTVRITLNQADNTFLDHLASQYAVILSKEYALQLNADDNLAQLDLLPVGTGVYQLNDYSQHDYVRLRPNQDYWGKRANIENMIIDVSTNGTGRMAKYLSHECDIAAFPEPSQLAALKEGYIVNRAGANLAYLAFNFNRPIGKNLLLRQKIAQSIDRGRLAKVLFYGIADVADKVLPNVLFNEPNANRYHYLVDLDDNDANEPLNLWVVDENRVYNPHPAKMATLIQSELAKAGIKLNIRYVSRAFVLSQLSENKADYDLILSGWLANNYNPVNFLAPLLSCQAKQNMTNLANWCNENFDYWIKQAQETKDPVELELRYQLTQSLLEDYLPLLPLVNVNRLLVVNDKVENVKLSPFGQVKLAEITLKQTENANGAAQ